MDLTSLMSALLSDNSINSVSGKTGASAGDVAGVMAAALPMLLNGANAQASNPETAESFHEAVNEHAERDPEEVDLAEGEKIVEHLLGDEEVDAEKAIAKKTGLSKAQVALILAALAPMLMKMLGKQTSGSSNANATASILGSLLGGGSNSSASSALMTAALGAVLSGALNGNSHNNSNSLLGSLLGTAVKPQQQTVPASASLLGSLLGATTPQNQQPSTASMLSGLLGGGMPQQNSSNAAAAALLGSLLGAKQPASNSSKPKPQQQAQQQDSLGSIVGLMNALLK